MRRRNIIAGFLLTPFLIMSTLLIARKNPGHSGSDGVFIIVFVFSVYTFTGSFIYLIANNTARLEMAAPIKFINKHINVFRVILLALGVLMALSLALAPKKPITPTKEAKTSLSPLRV